MAFVESTVDHLFGKCVGIVDTASGVFQRCKGHSNAKTREEFDASRLFAARKNRSRRMRRRQGHTLEVPAHGEFEDDVSALSANTLEEMERLAKHMARRAKRGQQTTTNLKNPLPGQQLVPPSIRTDRSTDQLSPPASVRDSWTYSVQRATSYTDQSIAVSTSGSSSSQEEPLNRPAQRVRTTR